MGFLSYCFPSTSSTSPLLSPSPTSGDSQRPASPTYFLSCIFCNVHDNVPSSRLRYEDDEFLVFQDRSPGGLQHLLCVPRKHYESVKTLNEREIPMLQKMTSLSIALLLSPTSATLTPTSLSPPSSSPPYRHRPTPSSISLPLSPSVGASPSAPFPSNLKLGFHIPPLTSVQHLHLHAFELPHLSAKDHIKYGETRQTGIGMGGKGFGWFVGVDQVMNILAAGKKVKVLPVSAPRRYGRSGEDLTTSKRMV